jgi:hypothetical protein
MYNGYFLSACTKQTQTDTPLCYQQISLTTIIITVTVTFKTTFQTKTNTQALYISSLPPLPCPVAEIHTFREGGSEDP